MISRVFLDRETMVLQSAPFRNLKRKYVLYIILAMPVCYRDFNFISFWQLPTKLYWKRVFDICICQTFKIIWYTVCDEFRFYFRSNLFTYKFHLIQRFCMLCIAFPKLCLCASHGGVTALSG